MAEVSKMVIKNSDVPVVFVNDVASGVVNGVVNLTFVTAHFTPVSEDGNDPDWRVTARLRMDLWCVQQLRDQCDRILAQQTMPLPPPAQHQPTEKIN